MSKSITPPFSVIIIGDIKGLGFEFSQLAAREGGNLLLIDTQLPSEQHLRTLHALGANHVQTDIFNLSKPETAQQIYDAWMVDQLFHNLAPLRLVIHIQTFTPNRLTTNPWTSSTGPESTLHPHTLHLLSQHFLREMGKRKQGGVVLNVLFRSPTAVSDPYVQEMFLHTQNALLEIATGLNQRLTPSPQVAVYTLSVSGTSFMLQIPPSEQLPSAFSLPAQLSPHDLTPVEVASIGYRIGRRAS